MKNFHFLALAAAVAALFSACEKPITGVQLDKSSLSFTAEGGTQTFEITAGTAWKLEALAPSDWCTVTPTVGVSSATVSVTVSPNVMKDAGRDFDIVVKYDEGERRVAVSQAKAEGEPVFSLSEKSFEMGAEGGQFAFAVVSDAADYDVTLPGDWIKLVSRMGNRYTGETLTFAVEPNLDKAARSGVVSICTKDGSCYPVNVKQAAFTGKLFARNHVAYRFTAVWCGWCPYMDAAFQAARAESDINFDFVTLHASEGYPLYFAGSDELSNTYKIKGFPSGVIDGWKAFDNNTDKKSAVKQIKRALSDFDKNFQCVAGISVNSEVRDDAVWVNASVSSLVNEDLTVVAFVLENGIVAEQAYYKDDGTGKTVSTSVPDFVHDNVARAALTKNPDGDVFHADNRNPSTFSWFVNLDKAWNPDKLSVAVLVLRDYGRQADKKNVKNYPDNYVVNSTIAPVGTTVELKYAK